MYEFLVGIILGVFATRLVSKKRIESKDSSVQVDETPFVCTAPIPVSRRVFIPGALSNFWGKDSFSE